MPIQEYQVVGRHLPTESEPTPKIYRMRIFAPNEVVAKSRFWYFLRFVHCFSVPRTSGWSSHRQLKKVKKASGEIIGVNVVCILDVPCSPQEAGGAGFADYYPCGFVRMFCGFFHRFTRESPWRSRTLASGSDTTLVQAPITCTRSFARSPELMLWRLFIRTWLPATVPDSGLSRWASRCPLANQDWLSSRFSGLLRLRRHLMSVVRTSSSFSNLGSSSLSLIALEKSARLLLLSALVPSKLDLSYV